MYRKLTTVVYIYITEKKIMSNGIAWHREITSAQWKALLGRSSGDASML